MNTQNTSTDLESTVASLRKQAFTLRWNLDKLFKELEWSEEYTLIADMLRGAVLKIEELDVKNNETKLSLKYTPILQKALGANIDTDVVEFIVRKFGVDPNSDSKTIDNPIINQFASNNQEKFDKVLVALEIATEKGLLKKVYWGFKPNGQIETLEKHHFDEALEEAIRTNIFFDPISGKDLPGHATIEDMKRLLFVSWKRTSEFTNLFAGVK